MFGRGHKNSLKKETISPEISIYFLLTMTNI